jgi:hypothetical protein
LRTLKKKSVAHPSPRPHPLTTEHTFLRVLSDACEQGGRYTLIAESSGNSFTVLVDRGGPFNASGAGRVGSDALMAAAGLSRGTYVMDDGWPVDQPHYQVGLDRTLRELLTGTRRVAEELPPPRGVDTLRNRAASEAPATMVSEPKTPAPHLAVPRSVRHLAPEAGPELFSGMAAVPSVPGSSWPTPPPAAEPVPMAPLPEEQPVPAAAPTATPAAETYERVQVDRIVPDPEPLATEVDTRLLPGSPDTSKKQGAVKHVLTQVVLWTLSMDEPGRYTLAQAQLMTRRALADVPMDLWQSFIGVVGSRASRQWGQVKRDWERSGEVAKKRRARRPGTRPR